MASSPTPNSLQGTTPTTKLGSYHAGITSRVPPTWPFTTSPLKLQKKLNLKTLLGLGLKFCLIPWKSTKNPEENLQRFQRNLLYKTFFAGRIQDNKEAVNSNLYIPSAWEPMEWDILPEIHK